MHPRLRLFHSSAHGQSAIITAISNDGRTTIQAIASRDGEFELFNMPEGDWWIYAKAAGYRMTYPSGHFVNRVRGCGYVAGLNLELDTPRKRLEHFVSSVSGLGQAFFDIVRERFR